MASFTTPRSRLSKAIYPLPARHLRRRVANYTSLAKFRATDLSDDPTYVEQRAYVEGALRKAGLPEQ